MKMNNLPTNIFVATEKDYPELSELWEASVRSTHHFLSEEDIQYYKPLVQNVYFPAVQLYIIKNKDNHAFLYGQSTLPRRETTYWS